MHDDSKKRDIDRQYLRVIRDIPHTIAVELKGKNLGEYSMRDIKDSSEIRLLRAIYERDLAYQKQSIPASLRSEAPALWQLFVEAVDINHGDSEDIQRRNGYCTGSSRAERFK